MASMETRTEYVYGSKSYVPQDAGSAACDGCAFEFDPGTSRCVDAGPCSSTYRDDGRDVIWVEAE